MKSLYSFPVLFFLHLSLFAQTPFILNFEQPEIDYISDVTQDSDKFYFIQNRVGDLNPVNNTSSFSDLLITNENGDLLEQYNLNGEGTNYQRIIKILPDEIYLAGYLTADSCKTKMVVSRFNLSTHALEHLSTYDLCDYTGSYMNLVKGLSGKIFIEEYHYVTVSYLDKTAFEIDPSYNIIPLPEAMSKWYNISVDFARTGYIVAEDVYYDFFRADFQYRKSRYTNDHMEGDYQSRLPFGNHLILENALKDLTYSDGGIQVRLIDSALHLVKKSVILPEHNFQGGVDLPQHGGIAVQNNNEIWSAGIFGRYNQNNHNTFISITKLNENLDIECQQFFGYEGLYDIYGLHALESGGAIYYGSRVRDGLKYNGGEDIFALRVSENCELNITSTEGPDHQLITISSFPNPGLNNLTFSVNGFDPSTLHVELINENGQVLFKKQDLSYSIQVPELPAGQYFYRILQNERLLGVGSWVKQ